MLQAVLTDYQPGTVRMTCRRQRAVDRENSQIRFVVCVLDGASTLADDTRSVMSIQLVDPALYTLRPSVALAAHLFEFVHPLAYLYSVSLYVPSESTTFGTFYRNSRTVRKIVFNNVAFKRH